MYVYDNGKRLKKIRDYFVIKKYIRYQIEKKMN